MWGEEIFGKVEELLEILIMFVMYWGKWFLKGYVFKALLLVFDIVGRL